MKASLVTSVALHALVLSWALFSLSGPKTMDVADVEALPVDLIPVQSITQVQKGDKKAPANHTPTPTPTERPDPVKDAQEIGDNSVDLKGPPTPKQSPKEVKAAAPPKVEEDQKAISDVPKPAAKPEPKQADKAAPAPATEVAEQPRPKQSVEPDPTPKETPPQPPVKAPEPTPQPPQQAESDKQEFASLPDSVPLPGARPQPPQAETAKTPDRKKVDTPAEAKKPPEKTPDKPEKTETAKAASKKSDFNADKIAALLNREEPSGGGAKRSTQQASLGADRTTGGEKLSQSEMDALRGQIQKNWNIIPGIADGQDVRITVSMRLDPSGAIVGEPQVSATGGSDLARRTLAGSAKRAVLMASPFQGLPRDKYNTWSEVVVKFDPSQMF